jgi:hypothetical protein
MWDLWKMKCTGAGFRLVFRFPLPIIPLTAPHSSSSIIQGPVQWVKQRPMYQVESNVTTPHETKKVRSHDYIFKLTESYRVEVCCCETLQLF